jgi:hypothetical protein
MPHSDKSQPHAQNTRNAQVRRLADYIEETGLTPLPLPQEFYYASLPLCVIDAVFSIGVTYTSTKNTVIRFCERQNWKMSQTPEEPRLQGEHTIADLVGLFDSLTPVQAANSVFGNRQRTSTRNGILKAEAVKRFATALIDARIDDFCDLSEDRLAVAQALIRGIPGQGSGISFDYFRMLAGDDNLVKPDRMVQRFVAQAIDANSDSVGPDPARDFLQRVVKVLAARGNAWSPRVLDYAIWQKQRSTA